eukprot:67426_3
MMMMMKLTLITLMRRSRRSRRRRMMIMKMMTMMTMVTMIMTTTTTTLTMITLCGAMAVRVPQNRLFANETKFVTNMGALVKRDRNHPSVVIWARSPLSPRLPVSITATPTAPRLLLELLLCCCPVLHATQVSETMPGACVLSFCNEGGCEGSHEQGGPRFQAIATEYDGTRPTLANMFTCEHFSHSSPLRSSVCLHGGNERGYDGGRYNDLLSNTIDVQGFSHQNRAKAESCHKALPNKPIFMSECCSCNTMRDQVRNLIRTRLRAVHGYIVGSWFFVYGMSCRTPAARPPVTTRTTSATSPPSTHAAPSPTAPRTRVRRHPPSQYSILGARSISMGHPSEVDYSVRKRRRRGLGGGDDGVDIVREYHGAVVLWVHCHYGAVREQYYGEPPKGGPEVSSTYGQYDLCGFPKAGAHARKCMLACPRPPPRVPALYYQLHQACHAICEQRSSNGQHGASGHPLCVGVWVWVAAAFWYRTQWLLTIPDNPDKTFYTKGSQEVHIVESWESPASWYAPTPFHPPSVHEGYGSAVAWRASRHYWRVAANVGTVAEWVIGVRMMAGRNRRAARAAARPSPVGSTTRDIHAYSSAPQAELLVNGKSMGTPSPPSPSIYRGCPRHIYG